MKIVLLIVCSVFLFSTELSARNQKPKPGAERQNVKSNEITFIHIQNESPWESAKCTHFSAEQSYDWNVTCDLNGTIKTYLVHLALDFYPFSQFVKSAYELLYWITDRSNPSSPKFSSTSMWIHSSLEDPRANLFEVGLGVDEDHATLKLSFPIN